ncbi:MAG: hypothetical protein JXB32_03050 [Deltaproteobacteria bacterium]|nr:hypothetical protein [Deltaproteobacteria bacterium]
MQRVVGTVAGLIAACLLLSGSTCDDESSTQGGTTPAARGRQAPPIEGGCPDASPTLTVDMNRDGMVDFQVVPEGGGTCRAADLNFDGVFDLFRHRDASGNLLREEADGDHDLRLDSVALYQAGAADPHREEFDSNWDGRVDLWVELNADCAFLRAPGGACTTRCGVDWCNPRQSATTEEDSYQSTSAEAEETPFVAVLYRDANGDALWDTAEVLLGQYPICVAFNTNAGGETPDAVHPEAIEVYKPRSAALGRPDIDYLRRDYLDLSGNPIVRCEDSDGAIMECPNSCAP